MPDLEYISTDEVADRLNYTPQHVSRLIRSGKLDGKKLGRDWIVVRESVERYLTGRANYSLPLNGDAANTRKTERPEENESLSFEEILSGGEPSLDMKRRAKALAWSNGAVPSETVHRVYLGDAREMQPVESESVHLVVTSPPYFNLIQYEGGGAANGQLGDLTELDRFLNELDRVWGRCFDALVPGGRMCIVLGDVCLSRNATGRHRVIPLHAHVAQRCGEIGFDYLTPIFWSKIANMATEVGGSARFLGKPYEPNAIIKNDVEYILLLRKPGSYRKPSVAQRALSLLEPEEHRRWFRSIWTDIRGESRKAGHPAPFPKELAYRLIKMFSFVGDVVLDPFWGTGSTTAAAVDAVRSSVGFEIESKYVDIGKERLSQTRSHSVPARFEYYTS